MNYVFYSSLLMFLSGIVVFCLAHKHILLSLFALEFIILLLYFLFFFFLLMFGVDLYFIMFYISFSVCEGALGLGVLVNMIRNHGNDYLLSLSILSW
uniref:NADH-ubiquinone oxidoreductase chain 4L n=1 Tax=Largus sp. TaxID=2931298 RepID=A0A8T9ZW96_9HEMI|nr:NADH dehydrogenase subunit 4L [Largus sp.]